MVAAYLFRSAKTGASASRECNSCEGFGSLASMYTTKSKAEFRKIDFGIFMEQFEDVWTSLVSSHEIFVSHRYLILIT
jgi:hypothetical protein